MTNIIRGLFECACGTEKYLSDEGINTLIWGYIDNVIKYVPSKGGAIRVRAYQRKYDCSVCNHTVILYEYLQ